MQTRIDPPEQQRKLYGPKKFTQEPKGDELASIRNGKIQPIYQCRRCNRTHKDFPIILLAGWYYCDEHYAEERISMRYDEKQPFQNNWRDVAVAEISARHQDRQRGDDETRSAYQNRMITLMRGLMGQRRGT